MEVVGVDETGVVAGSVSRSVLSGSCRLDRLAKLRAVFSSLLKSLAATGRLPECTSPPGNIRPTMVLLLLFLVSVAQGITASIRHPVVTVE